MPPPHLALWAKLGAQTWPTSYHPLLCHLIDVAAVARQLWENVFRPHFRQWIAARLGLDEAGCARWLAFWCGAHDIGKAAACFQDLGNEQTKALRDWLGTNGFSVAHGKGPPHGTISTAVLADLLENAAGWPKLARKFARSVATAVGGHHGVFPAASEWSNLYEVIRSDAAEPWHTARRDMLQCLAEHLGLEGPAPQSPDSADQSVFMVLAGLTSVADWIGSNQTFFKPVGNPALADGTSPLIRYRDHAEAGATDALRQLGWLDRSPRGRRRTFIELFRGIVTGPPRDLQRAVEAIVAEQEEPALLLIEAPMGEGKTEAAWYVADCWDQTGGQGAYVALPTMATSNQMYKRVAQFLERNAGKNNLQLLHSKALLNDCFNQRLRLAELHDEDGPPSPVVAEAWFADNKKHGLLAAYGVGTIDQCLLAVLQTKHVFVRLFGLAGKCVILDEVHAYDAYTSTLMKRLLAWLAALGCPVVLLSATLPREKRVSLLRAYAGDGAPEPDNVPYPRLTRVTVGECASVTVSHIDADPLRTVRVVQLGWLDANLLADRLRESLAAGGCAVVIRNTVGLAQETYLKLRDSLKSARIRVGLFHARFPFGRRMKIENAVLRRFGKDSGPAERDRRVLVATQVVEQSLDLDFDLMVSDVAPVDLVLQRAGRLHRHERGARPAGVAVPRLWLIEPEVAAGLPDFAVSGVIYARYILFRSLLILREKNGAPRTNIELPEEIDGMVEAAYASIDPPASLTDPERAFWAGSKEEYEADISHAEGEAEGRQIRKPRDTGALARLVSAPREEENPELHPAHQALTRLAPPTAQLICLEAAGEGAFRLIHDETLLRTLAVRITPARRREDIQRLLLGELTTAHPGLVRELWHSPRRRPEWKEVGMLCRHHQITFEGGRTTVGKYELLLDKELGLRVLRGAQGEDE